MADIAGMSAAEAWLTEQWLAKLSLSIGSMMGDAPKVTAGDAVQQTPSGEEILWWEQPYSVSPEAICWVGALPAAWKTIGNEVLKSAGIDDADEDNIKSTYLEILSQALSGLGQAISARVRTEVTCAGGGEAKSPPTDSLPVLIDLGGSELTLFVAFSKPLADLRENTPAAAPTPIEASGLPPSAKKNKESETTSKGYPRGLDLLLDVELPVSVSFGRAELSIKDVIKLTSGSIVELNRSITEPVEVIVNNVVIARGEVVVVEGNFGVRIKQVISRQERLRTLR